MRKYLGNVCFLLLLSFSAQGQIDTLRSGFGGVAVISGLAQVDSLTWEVTVSSANWKGAWNPLGNSEYPFTGISVSDNFFVNCTAFRVNSVADPVPGILKVLTIQRPAGIGNSPGIGLNAAIFERTALQKLPRIARAVTEPGEIGLSREDYECIMNDFVARVEQNSVDAVRRDSTYSLATIADTLSLSPIQGDRFVLPGLIGFYDSGGWVLASTGGTGGLSDTSRFVVYAPAHLLEDSISTYGYVPVKVDYTKANTLSFDSTHFAYAIGAPDPDSLELKLSGPLSIPGHGLTVGRLYYLQDDGSESTTPAAIRAPTVYVLDPNTVVLTEVGADQDQVISRQVVPSPLFIFWGGDPQNPSDSIMQVVVDSVFKPAGLAKPSTIFFMSYSSQSKNPTYQDDSPTDSPLNPSHSWFYDGNVVTRMNHLLTSVNLEATSAGLFALTPVTVSGNFPTDLEVANWLDTNYINNELRLPNGAIVYWQGSGTPQSPDYSWMVIDDITNTGETDDSKRILKRVATRGIKGSGTLDYLAKWASPDSLTNADITDNGTLIDIGASRDEVTVEATDSVLVDGPVVNIGGQPSATIRVSDTDETVTVQAGSLEQKIAVDDFGFNIQADGGSYYLATGSPPVDGKNHVQAWFNGSAQWLNLTDSLAAAGGGGGGGGHIIADEGSALTTRDTLDFQGAGVTVTDGTTKTIVTISGDNLGDHTATTNLNMAGNTILGGTGTGSDLILQSTSGVGDATSEMLFLVGNNGGTEAMRIRGNGNVGINQSTPTARLHLPAGSATAGTAPMKFTAGTKMTTTEEGALEYDGDYHASISTSNYTSAYPPAHSSTYVKATSSLDGNYRPWFATDPSKSLTGTHVGNNWVSSSATNQRFNIDLGSAKVVQNIYYENSHFSGGGTNTGVRAFTLYGSNSSADFADSTYASTGSWVLLTTGAAEFDQHVALDVIDPKTITVTNSTPYRYYSIKFSSNWGSVSYYGVRRIELQEGGNKRRRVVLEEKTLQSGQIPLASTGGRLTNSGLTYVSNTLIPPYFRTQQASVGGYALNSNTGLYVSTLLGGTNDAAIVANYANSTAALGEVAVMANRNSVFQGLYVNGTGTSLTYGAYFQGNKPVIINGPRLGIGLTSPSYILDISGTDGARIPVGTTAQRPTNALAVLRGSSTDTDIEWGDGANWWKIPKAAISTYTAGSVLFAGTDGSITQDNSYLNWDNTAKRLTLNSTVSETYPLTITHSAPDGIDFQYNTGSNTTNGTEFAFLNFRPRYSGAINQEVASISARYEGDGTTRRGAIIIRGHDGTGLLALATISPDSIIMKGNTVKLDGTGALQLHDGTTGARPTNVRGKIRSNSTTGNTEIADGTNWFGLIQDGGNASDTTDGSGDITVSHTLGTATFSAVCTATGATFYNVQVHTKTSTTFKIRFFDAAGSAVTSAAVAADWIAKKL